MAMARQISALAEGFGVEASNKKKELLKRAMTNLQFQ